MAEGADYPVFLAFGFLFLAGYLVRTLFLSLRLPAVVGVIVVGMAFSTFIQEDVLYFRDTLQESAFFLVLLKAGLEIHLKDLNIATVVLAWVPVSVELMGLTLYAVLFWQYSLVEGLILGTVLCCMAEGLVIPKMHELGRAFPEHPLPRQVFTCAPLEASFVLTLFGIFSGFVKPFGEPAVPVGHVIAANALRIACTLVAGATLGSICGILVPRRTLLTIWGRQVFTGAPVESFLIVFGVALVAFGLGMDKDSGRAMLPMAFAPGSVFSPELLVITFGAALAAFAPAGDLHEVELVLGGVWVFGQILLFSMLGSKTCFDAFREFPRVLPLMLTGFLFRAVAVTASVMGTRRWRVCIKGCQACRCANKRSTLPDVAFCFVASLPRATIQGALASVPLRKGFFREIGPSGVAIAQLMADAGRIYIPLMAILGSILLDILGPRLLRLSAGWAQRHDEAEAADREQWIQGWKGNFTALDFRASSSRSIHSVRIEPLNTFEAYADAESYVVSRRNSVTDELSAIGLSSGPSSVSFPRSHLPTA